MNLAAALYEIGEGLRLKDYERAKYALQDALLALHRYEEHTNALYALLQRTIHAEEST